MDQLTSTSRVNVVLDASLLDLVQLCPRKYYYRQILLRVPQELAPALDKGGLFHIGKEFYFKELKSTGDWVRAVDAGLYKMREHYSIKSELEIKDASWIYTTFEQESLFNKELDLSIEIHEVEKSFMYVLYEDEFIRLIMIGKIDLIFSNKNYKFIPLDHKTFERDFGLRRRGNQFVNYTTALDCDYLFVNRVGLQTSYPPEKKFSRLPLSFDVEYKQAWKLNTIKWAYDYLNFQQTNDWPMNLTSCDKFNRNCDYYDICETSGEKNKLYKLMTFFKAGEVWDVSKSLEKRGQ